MPSITLNEKKINQLHTFINKHNVEKIFIAKDQGAYVGAGAGKEKCIFYFQECDPRKDEDWWDNARAKFGGDDFGEFMPASAIKDLVAKGAKKIVFNVTSSSITMKAFG